MAAVAVATAAIVIVLSVFNGFTSLAEKQFSLIDPDLMVVPASGKVFSDADSLAAVLRGIDGVAIATPTLTERGLAMVHDRQQAVVFKGVEADYARAVPLRGAVRQMLPADSSQFTPAALAVGVAAGLDLRAYEPVELYVPRRVGRINPANPAGAFFSATLQPAAILAVNQGDFDADHILLPIDVARDILQYTAEASAIEISAKPGVRIASLMHDVKHAVGPAAQVLDRRQQHAEAYRMIAIEKWVTFAMLIFILVVASFNIISTLSLMVIEKRDNMATLSYMGATRGTIRAAFAWMGAFITLVGGAVGIVCGTALSLAQQWGHFIRLGGDPAQLTITYYPVHVEAIDIAAVALLTLGIAALSALITRLLTKRL